MTDNAMKIFVVGVVAFVVTSLGSMDINSVTGALAPSEAKADVILTYTGMPFLRGNMPGSVNAVLDFSDSTLPVGFTGFLRSFDATNWDFKASGYENTPANSYLNLSANIILFNNGNITDYVFDVYPKQDTGAFIAISTDGDQIQLVYQSTWLLQYGHNVDQNSLGTWTITRTSETVPEPCTILLFGFGLAGVAALRKKIRAA